MDIGNHLSKLQVFKVHFEIAFSAFEPSWNRTDLWTYNFPAFVVMLFSEP